jgi:hypothetical protein
MEWESPRDKTDLRFEDWNLETRCTAGGAWLKFMLTTFFAEV